jgi:hypothetical protein
VKEFARNVASAISVRVKKTGTESLESGDEHVNRMRDNWLAKIAKNEEEHHLDSPQNIAAKVRHEHRRRTGTLDKIQDMVL